MPLQKLEEQAASAVHIQPRDISMVQLAHKHEIGQPSDHQARPAAHRLHLSWYLGILLLQLVCLYIWHDDEERARDASLSGAMLMASEHPYPARPLPPAEQQLIVRAQGKGQSEWHCHMRPNTQKLSASSIMLALAPRHSFLQAAFNFDIDVPDKVNAYQSRLGDLITVRRRAER